MSLIKDIYKKITGGNKKSSKKSAGKSGGKKASQSKPKQNKSNTSTKPKTPAKSPSRAVQNYQNNPNKKPTSPSQTLWGSYASSIAQNNKAQQEKREQLKKQQEQQRNERRQKQLADANKAKKERIAKEKEQKRRESIDKNARINAETKKQKDEYYKGKDWKKTKKQIKNSTIADERIALEKQGASTKEQLDWLKSDSGKKETKKNYKTAKDATKAEINKQIDKSARKSVNKQIKAKDKKQETIDRGDLTYMSRADGAFHTTGEVEANQIQGAKAYADAHKTAGGRVAMGAISAFTPTSYGEETGMARDVYTDKQKKELLKNKDKFSYKAGEFAGNALAFAVPGMAGAKKADTVLKGAETLGGRALNLAKRTGIETAYNTPMNAYQALKGARDENGNLSLENYGKSFGRNTATDLGMGAGANLIGAGANKVLGKRYIDLLAKAESGKATPKELEQIQKLKESFNTKSEIASHYANSDKIQTAINKTDDVVAKAKTALNADESKQLIDLKAKESAGQADIGDKIKIAETESKIEESRVPEKANYKRDANGRADVANEKIAPEDKEYQTSYVKEENVPDKHKAMFEEYKNSTNPKLTQYAKDVYNGVATEKTAHLEKVPQHLSKKVEEITGIDVSGFEHIIGKNDIEHIRNDHSKFSTQNPTDHTMSDVNDIGRIEYVVLNADDVKRALDKNGEQRYASGYFDKNQKPAPQVLFEKQIDGKMYVCESVVDSKNGTIRVTSAYITNVPKSDKKAKPNKIEAPQTSDRSKDSPPITSENGTGYASDNIIQSQKPEVNSVKETSNDGVKPADDGIKADKSNAKSVKEMTDDELAKRKERLESDIRWSKQNSGDAITPNNKKRISELDKIKSEIKSRRKSALATEENAQARESEGRVVGNRQPSKSKERSPLESDTNKVRDAVTSVRRLFEDSFIAIETTAKKLGGKEGERLLVQVNNVRNAKNMASQWLSSTRRTFDGEIGGKALDDIFTRDLMKNTEKYNDFQTYLIYKHVPARHARGTDIFFDVSPEHAEKKCAELLEKYGGELEAFEKDIHEYLDALQDYRVDTGMLSAKDRQKFAERYPNYVPTNRVGDTSTDFFTSGRKLDNNIRTAQGGEDTVLDLYQQITSATKRTIEAGQENIMLKSYFEAKGVSPDTLKKTNLEDLEHASIHAEVNGTKAKISFFVDGKPVTLNADHQVARGIREWNGEEFETLLNWSKKASVLGKPFKQLITDWNIFFGIRNGARDMQQAVVNTKSIRHFTASMPSATRAIANKNNAYRKLYESLGGKYAQLVSFDGAGNMNGFNKGFVDKVIDAEVKAGELPILRQIEAVNGSIEMMPRMSEFIGTIRRETKVNYKKLKAEVTEELKAKGLKGSELSGAIEDEMANRIVKIAGKDTVERAMRNANDITLNFSRSGVIGKALNMGFVPYFNPSIQGLSKLGRQFTETAMEDGWKGILNLGLKISTITVAPALINEALLSDNEDYQSLNTRDKDNNYFIPIGDGKFLKLPKPRENAVLAEPAEYAFRYFYTDKAEYAYFDMGKLKTEHPFWNKIPLTDEGKQSFRTAIDNIGVVNPFTSNLVSPLINTARNKTWFGGNIESAYETSEDDEGNPKVAVKDRFDASTSAIAIKLGQSKIAQELNLSPKKIDNLMDSYLGMIYDLGISQTSDRNKAEISWKSNPAVNQFVTDSLFSNKLATKAWSKVDGMKESEATSYKSKYMYDTYKFEDAENMIYSDKSLTKAQKVEAVRELRKNKNEIFRSAIDGKDHSVEPLSIIAKHLGADKTLSNFLPKPKEGADKDVKDWSNYYDDFKKNTGFKKLSPKQQKRYAEDFLMAYSFGVKCQSKIGADFHDSPKWGTTGVATMQLASEGKLSEKMATEIAVSAGVFKDTVPSYQKYIKYGGDVDRYAVTAKRTDKLFEYIKDEYGKNFSRSGVWAGSYGKGGVKGGAIAMQLSTSKVEFADRAYYISNYSDEDMMLKMNASRGFAKKYGHTTEELIKMANKADKNGDGNTYLSQEEVRNYCANMKGNNEEKAMAFVLLGGNPNKNPYGSIGDYSSKRDTGITADAKESSGGRGRRRGGWGHHGGGGGGKGSDDWMAWLKEQGIIGGTTATGGTSVKMKDNTSESALNDAYRKRVRKLMTNK